MKGKRIIALLLSVFMVLSMIPTTGLGVMTVEAASKPKLAKKKASVVIGGTARIKVKNAPKGAKITYKSKKKAVATVSKKGQVKGVKSGTATIIVSVKKNAKTTKLKYRVTVKKPQLSNNSLSMTPGKSTALSVKNRPKKATYTWSSGNPQIAAVNKKGEVTAVAKGSTTIKVKVKTAKKTYQLSCRVEVTASPANEEQNSGSVPELTVSSLSETETNHVTTETIDISGTASSASGTVKEVTYSLRFTLDETASVTGKAEGTAKWTIKALPLQIGTSFLTITAVDSKNRSTQKVITLNRLSTEITLAENVIAYTEEQSADIAGDILDYWTDDMGTEGNTIDDQIIVLFSEQSEIVQSVKNGLIEAGDVVMLQTCDELYLGFNGVFLSNGEAEDAEKYPPEEYELLSFRAADYTDIFEGDVSLSYEFADMENILAFAYFPSEVDIYAQDDDGNRVARLYSNAKSTSEEYGDQSAKQKITQPGFQKNAISYMMDDALNMTGGIGSEKGVNIGLKFKDAVLYDKDGKDTTTNDQFKFGGSISFEQLNVDAGIEWHPNFNPFSLDLLPQQIIAKYSYTEKIDAHAEWTDKLNLDDVKDSNGEKVGLVKAANKLLNNDFENNKKFLGMTLSGVDMSDSIILGAIGLQVTPTTLTPIRGIKEIQYTSVFVPLSAVLVIMPVIDINGELSAKVGLTYKYTSYNEKGVNMQKKDFVGTHGSLSENKGQSSTYLGCDRYLEIYDVCSKSSSDKKSDPAWSFTLEGDGKAKAGIAVGADIGVMVAGIMPTSAEGKLYASTEVEGDVKLSVDNEKGLTVDALSKVDSKVGVKAAAHFKLAVASAEGGPELKGDSPEWDKVLWEAHLSSAYIDGTVTKTKAGGGAMGGRGIATAGENDEPIAGAAVTLTRMDQVGKPTKETVSDEEGKYRFDDVADGKYKITVSKEGYKTYESDEVEMSGTHKTVDVTLDSLSKPQIESDSSMDAKQKVTWDCVWFGSYPQSEVKVGEEEYTTLQNVTGWSNNEVTIDGVKYRRMKRGDATYSVDYEDEYYQWPDMTSWHYFRYEKIKWRVLDVSEGKALILSDQALDDQIYYEPGTDTTWENCTIRTWLNNTSTSKGFRGSAFSAEEQGAIQQTSLINEDNSQYDTDGGNNTKDYIFLLSESDVYSGSNAAAYGFVRDEETCDEARRTQGTAYAKAMGLYTECAETAYAGNCIWWLRTPGVLSTFAGTADYDGYVDMDGMDVDSESIGVRPALWIDTTADCWSDAGTVCSDGTVLEK